jgi:hypothetical protein
LCHARIVAQTYIQQKASERSLEASILQNRCPSTYVVRFRVLRALPRAGARPTQSRSGLRSVGSCLAKASRTSAGQSAGGVLLGCMFRLRLFQ